ncbi:MAG: AAA family ATPase [Ktedonobacteraceae bacterium]
MLKRVKIQGYKSLADVEVNLQPLSVLFGPNASGKSHFLDALQLLSRIATGSKLKDAFNYPYRGTPLESFTFGNDGIQGLLAKDRITFSIEVDVELSQGAIDAANQQFQNVQNGKTTGEKSKIVRESSVPLVQGKDWRYRVEVEFSPKTGTVRLAREILASLSAGIQPEGSDIGSFNSDFSIFSDLTYLVAFPQLLAVRGELASWFFYYLEPRERMRIPSPVKEVRQIGMMGEELDAFLNTLRAANPTQFNAIERALHMVVPSVTGIDVGVNNLGDVELRLMQGETPISARVVSDGTLRTLGLLALTGVKEPPTLIGLEEPENGINPARIRLIALFLETRAMHDTQMIVTTHSPVLTDLISHKSLFVCRRNKGNTVIEPYSVWEYPEMDKAFDDEEDLPESTVSERILRGDFDAEH